MQFDDNYEQAIEQLKAAVERKKLAFYDMCLIISHIRNDEELHDMGMRNKTKAQAMESFFKLYEKDIEMTTQEFLKKFPD